MQKVSFKNNNPLTRELKMMNIFPKTLLEKRYQNYWRLVSIFNEIDIEKKLKIDFLFKNRFLFTM